MRGITPSATPFNQTEVQLSKIWTYFFQGLQFIATLFCLFFNRIGGLQAHLLVYIVVNCTA